MGLKACLKKDILDEIRTKKFLRNCLLSVGMVLLACVVFLVMGLFQNISTGEGADDIFVSLQDMFKPTYFNFTMYFGTFMMTYFTLIYIILLRNVLSKEISQNKWLLPITSGISTKHLIISKIIVKTISLVIAELIAILLHFVILLIFFEGSDLKIGSVLLVYLSIVLFTILMATMTISINSISKNDFLGAIISIVILILGTTILQSIFIKENALINYTPLAFYQIVTNPQTKLTLTEWIVSSLTYVGTILGLSIWAIFSSKLKPIKTKK